MKCCCLLNCGDVPESPNSKLLDLLLYERRLRNFFPLKTYKHYGRRTLVPQSTFVFLNGNIKHQFKKFKPAHKYMKEFEDPFVGQNVQDISRPWIDDGQPVDLIFE